MSNNLAADVGLDQVEFSVDAISSPSFRSVTTFQNGFTPNAGDWQVPQWCVVDNRVYFRGLLRNPNRDVQNGDVIFMMPVGYRPAMKVC